ncbi:MAG: TonB-dependent receptor plug domain-containing protein [Candidatus Symbiothrix sp.]|jgi:outer membrane cobalamin receptor|nr:TonB-dependent receptor plug domain-containing protein [Candidatus Symbiothrix sp.]
MYRHIFFIFYLFGIVGGLHATPLQTNDSTIVGTTHVLDEVEVRATKPSTFLSTSSTQVLQAGDWTKLGASQVSDAVKHFSGVQVKDYGGVGGLKTVSIRSLGANHTGVIYDGVPVSDMQTGQIDLGRFSLNFVDMLSLTIGESDLIFQTAQAQALAGALSITTGQEIPACAGMTSRGHSRAGGNPLKVAVHGGSFGLFNPSIMYSKPLSPAFSLNFSADYLTTNGNYPFTQTIGDSLAHRKRSNSDVETLKFEANLNGKFNNGGRLQFKTGLYTSDRGLPGIARYYNDYSGERLNNKDYFSQIHFVQPLNDRWDLLANAKLGLAYTNYMNIPFPGGETESNYYQSECYTNATVRHKFSKNGSMSWANDLVWNDFSKSNFHENAVSRTTWLSALAAQYENSIFTLTAKLLNTFAINDSKNAPVEIGNYHNLSPYIGVSLLPLKNLPLRVRAFYKNSYRMPTFGDLYYGLQSRNLKPEKANQLDFGVTFVQSFSEKIPYFSFSGDVYTNRVRDKIVAIPGASMFAWSMQNYGKVDITGVDINIATKISRITVSATYTYQDALDKTDRESTRFNNQIPYTAKHSASGVLGLQTAWLDINYNILYCGQRYYGRVNQSKNRLPAFAEQGISLQRDVKFKQFRATFTGECKNMFNKQYEVVKDYPMPGRSVLLGIKIIN